MKRIIMAAAAFFVLYACSKNNLNSSSIATQFVGNWKVYESVDQSSFSRWHVATDTFLSKTIKTDDTTFAVIQSNRVPVPDWVGSGSFSADTLYFNPVLDGFKLFNNAQGELGTFSENKDTLSFLYLYGGPMVGGNGSVYWVSQKWVRQ